MRERYIGWAWIGCFVFGAVVGAMAADDDDGWDVSLNPYYAALAVDADITIGASRTAISDAFPASNGAFDPGTLGMVATLYRNGWGLFLAPQYFSIQHDDRTNDLAEISSLHTVIDVGVGREFHFDAGDRFAFRVAPCVGLRYRNLRQDFEYLDTNRLERSSSSVEPVFGLDADWRLSRGFALHAFGDVSGLDLGDGANLAWSTTVMARWYLAQDFHLGLGYRYGQTDLSTQVRGESFGFDGSYQGAVVMLGMDFRSRPPPRRRDDDDIRELVQDESRYSTEGLFSSVPATADPTEYRVRRWMERTHEGLYRTVDGLVGKADRLLLEEGGDVLDRMPSFFYVGVDLEFKDEDGLKFKFRPKGSARVQVPNLQRKVDLFISDRAVDELPGRDSFDQDRGLSVGLETRSWLTKKAKVSAEVRSSSSGLELIGRWRWQPKWERDYWLIMPSVEAYYRTSRGLGGIGFIMAEYRVPDRFQATYTSSIADDEKREFPEVGHAVFASYLFEGTHEDYHRALMTGFTAYGDTDRGINEYAWEPLTYRSPLYGRWLYASIGPKFEWKRDNDWKMYPGLRIYLEAMFWGTEKR